MVDINCNLHFMWPVCWWLVAVKMSLSEVCEDNGDGLVRQYFIGPTIPPLSCNIMYSNNQK